MALEDRVKLLEDELKVLKNEIQTTLLDIQEQVLSHYYPSLYPSLNTEASRAKAPVNPPQADHYHQPDFPVHGVHSKYKTKTITLLADVDEQDPERVQEPDERVLSDLLAAQSASVPDHDLEPPIHNGQGHSPKPPDKKQNASHLNSSSRKSAALDKNLIEENEKFLDSLLNAMAEEAEEEEVSFDVLGDLIQKNITSPEYDGEPITGEILDELFNETFPFLDEDNTNETQSVLEQNNDNETPTDSKSLNSEAIKLTVRKLLSWVDESVALIGKTRTKQAVEMYVRAGDLSPDMHDTLLALVDSNQEPPPFVNANIKQIINTLGKLNDILDLHTPEYLAAVMNFISEVNFG